MPIQILSPIALLPSAAGLTAAPSQGQGGAGHPLDVPQKTAQIGDPAPIIFCRRDGDRGGFLQSPPATEGRFQNVATTNTLTASYLLVLGDGHMEQVQVRDILQGPCRYGTSTQHFSGRAGTWSSGNVIVTPTDPDATPWECPWYCGSGGTYRNLTTLSFVGEYLDGDERWSRQIHVFHRGGRIIDSRLLDDLQGPSSNFADLALLLMRLSSRIPEDLIDTSSMLAAARFTDGLGMAFDGAVAEPDSLKAWLDKFCPWFLLRPSRPNGRYGLRPLLATTRSGEIYLGPYSLLVRWTFEPIHIQAFSREFIDRPDIAPARHVGIWRQQPENDVGIIRSTVATYSDWPDDAQEIVDDLSGFATSEEHVVKVMAYKAARRRYVAHVARLEARPDSYNQILTVGDIVRVIIPRDSNLGIGVPINYYYEISRIGKGAAGDTTFDLLHVPVDALGRSLVAVDVAQATGSGYLIESTRTNFSCDANSDTDDSDIGDDFSTPDLPPEDAFDASVGNLPLEPLDPDRWSYDPARNDFFDAQNQGLLNQASSGRGATTSGASATLGGGEGGANPQDIVDEPQNLPIETAPEGPYAGSEVTAVDPETVCTGSTTKWFKVTPQGFREEIDGSINQLSLALTTELLGYTVFYEIECPDGEKQESEKIVAGSADPPESAGPFQLYVFYTKFNGFPSCSYEILGGPYSARVYDPQNTQDEEDARAVSYTYALTVWEAIGGGPGVSYSTPLYASGCGLTGGNTPYRSEYWYYDGSSVQSVRYVDHPGSSFSGSPPEVIRVPVS